jgi:hypothetical protein
MFSIGGKSEERRAIDGEQESRSAEHSSGGVEVGQRDTGAGGFALGADVEETIGAEGARENEFAKSEDRNEERE